MILSPLPPCGKDRKLLMLFEWFSHCSGWGPYVLLNDEAYKVNFDHRFGIFGLEDHCCYASLASKCPHEGRCLYVCSNSGILDPPPSSTFHWTYQYVLFVKDTTGCPTVSVTTLTAYFSAKTNNYPMFFLGCLDLRSTAALRQQEALSGRALFP